MADWIMIVDNDLINLKSAGRILSKNHMRVTAFRSGQALLDYLADNEFPDLILLDLKMPGMDGFETLKRLREMEKGREETPVIFLTAADDPEAEITGLQMGAMDFIRKPFIPDVLTGRVQRILRTQERLHRFEKAATVDRMTGFMNKESSEKSMKELCATETGFLCVLDLDTFKPVNDIYGHETGDQILVLFSELLHKAMRFDDVCGRIGGDEFVLFIRNMKTEEELRRFISRINEAYSLSAGKLIGPEVPLGVSVGAVSVPDHGRDYNQLFHMADEALYNVKQNGRHGCCLYGSTVIGSIKAHTDEMDLESITMILEERSAPASAMWMGREAFISIYRYMTRYMERYHGIAYRTLFTIRMTDENSTQEDRKEIMAEFRKLMQNSLRNSDIMVEISDRQLFMLLPETRDSSIGMVIGRLLDKWKQSEFSSKATITYETGRVQSSSLRKREKPAADGPGGRRG